jgi:AraC-like DNA-binding protein
MRSGSIDLPGVELQNSYPREPYSLSVTPKAILEYCERKGISRYDILSDAGISESADRPVDADAAFQKIAILWEAALKKTGDAAIAIQVGQSIPIGAFHFVDHIFMLAPNGLDALDAGRKFFHLINTEFEFSAEVRKNKLVVELHSARHPEFLSTECVHYAFSAVLSRLQLLCGTNYRPRQVFFRNKGRAQEQFSRILGCPVQFGSSNALIIFDLPTLYVQRPFADPELFEIVCSYGESKFQKTATIVRVGRADFHETLIAGLRNQKYGLNRIARELAMSTRTLQRALKASGTSYRKEIDRIRLQLTTERLSDGKIDEHFICGTLGFQDTRSFYRAFKRWTGMNPSGYLSKSKILRAIQGRVLPFREARALSALGSPENEL